MKKFILLITTIICSLPSISYAYDFSACMVIEIVASGERNGHIQLSCTINPAPSGCSNSSFIGFDKSNDEGKQYMAIALTAFSTGAKLSGNVHDSSCAPNQTNVPWVTQLRMKR